MIACQTLQLMMVPLTYRVPFVTRSVTRTDRPTLLLRCTGVSGAVVWSECPAFSTPDYWYETTDTAWWALDQHLIPALMAHPGWQHPTDVSPFLNQVMVGHPMAKSAIEMAMWSLFAAQSDQPLAACLGAYRDRIPVTPVVGCADTAAALDWLREGCPLVKLKASSSDIPSIMSALSAYPGKWALDANTGFTLRDMAHLKGSGVAYVEQPFPIGDWDALSHVEGVPVALDESLQTVCDVTTCARLGGASLLTIKPSRLGGFGPSLAVWQRAQSLGLSCWVGGMHESAIGRHAALHLASVVADRSSDLMPSHGIYAWDVAPSYAVNSLFQAHLPHDLQVNETEIDLRVCQHKTYHRHEDVLRSFVNH